MSADTPLLVLANVSRHFSGGDTPVKALDDISLEIRQGEFVAIMGQSGSGKSTLMNILGCLDRPTAGCYCVMGQDVAQLDGDALAALRRDTFGFVFQRYNLLATATAEENVEIPGIYARTPRAARKHRARALLTQLGLAERSQHRPSQLSGGQQQRVAVARALMNAPAVILADEPTGALDSQSGAHLMNVLKDLHQQGHTIILITHDESVATNAHRIVRLQDGKLLTQTSSPQGPLSSRYQHRRAPGNWLADILESTRVALRALRANLFRTVLTLLGIIIGVAAVVTMLAVGDGSKKKVLDQINAMGTDLISVRAGAPGIRGGGDVTTLKLSDADAISSIDNVDTVVPERSGRYTLRVGNNDYATTVQAIGEHMPRIRDWPLAAGSFFSSRDMQSYAPVIVLGETVKQKLFPHEASPLGQYVLVRNVPFEVIGIMAPKGAAPWGADQDDQVFVPLSTGIIRLFGQNHLQGITIRVQDMAALNDTQDKIAHLMHERHRVEDYSVRNMAALLETASSAQDTLTVMLGAVAAISLLVGGIGVMNIMLVSVAERKREIGLRMATGARARDILLQFTTEAGVVCSLGGCLGVVLGLTSGWVLQRFDIPVIFSLWPALMALACAFAISLVFGYLPARKAAKLDPVQALASE